MMRWFAGFLVTLLLLWALPAPAGAAAPAVAAKAWALIDGDTGQVLTAANPDARNFPASTTKLLTALVATEHGTLDAPYQVTVAATDLPPDSSLCGIKPGEKQTLRALLYGLLLPSGNDCAMAIAVGETNGKPAQFVTWMNEKAAALGLTHSHFTNVHGLHNANHYTTASDLALIARAAFANPTVREIAGAKAYDLPGHGALRNHDDLLFDYPGAVAGKTGFTEEAASTLVTAARRNGRYLIGVIMGEQNRAHMFTDMAALLDYGFAGFRPQSVISAGQSFAAVPVTGGARSAVAAVAGQPFSILVDGAGDPVRTVETTMRQLTAPVPKGAVVGYVQVFQGARPVGVVPLVAAADVKAAFWFLRLPPVPGWALPAALCLLGLYILRLRALRRQSYEVEEGAS